MIGEFGMGLASGLATDAIKTGAGALKNWAVGDAEQQALQRCLKAAFRGMLATLSETEEKQRQIGEAFQHAMRDTAAVTALLHMAVGPDPSSVDLRGRFIAAGLDPETLGVNVDSALSVMVRGLATELRTEAARENSPLFNRVHLADLHAIRDGLAELANPSGRSKSQPRDAAVVADIPPAYLDWLKRTYANVNLLGQEADKGYAFQLDHVYVPALTAASRRAAAGDRKMREPEEQRLVPLLQRLDEESLYVLAQAGAGKSTFCCWAVLRSIAGEDLCHPVPAPQAFAEPVPERLRGRLPVLVPFREFAPRTDWGRGGQTWRRVDLERALAAWVDGAIEDLSGALLTAHLKAGTTFLLLDGLDELSELETRGGEPVYPRELVLSALADALPGWLKAGNRILLTSRPAGMERAGFHRLRLDQAPLAPLPEELQNLFVRRWFHTLRKEDLAAGLIETIHSRDELARLVENPMLLTALCILYESGGSLPGDRYKLYKRIVDNVLVYRFPGGARQTEPVKARLEAIALRMHEGEKAEPCRSPVPEISELEVEQVLRDIAAEHWCEEDRRVEPTIRRNELLEKSGLLLPRPDQQVAFYHLSFQEYLAAERLLKCSDDLEAVIRERSVIPEWRLTLLFLFAGKGETTRPDWGSRLLDRLIETQPREAVKANAAPALFIAEALDLILAKYRPLPDPVKDAFARLALEAIEDEIALPARQALGLTLGRLGDTRIRSLRDPEAYEEVPAGAFPYGKGGHTIEIPAPFRFGKYPVTNSQYAKFIEAGGYRDEGQQWWSVDGWAWRQGENTSEPMYWRDRRWNAPSQPVVGVSFWEAEACAAWAGGRLPSEYEWEYAARGTEGLSYPWGNDWENGICNTFEAGLSVTSPVGLFPRSCQSQWGIEDLIGNVWEWCTSFYRNSDAGMGPSARRVLRGGSWYSGRFYARSLYRNMSHPSSRSNFIGFRVVYSPQSSES